MGNSGSKVEYCRASPEKIEKFATQKSLIKLIWSKQPHQLPGYDPVAGLIGMIEAGKYEAGEGRALLHLPVGCFLHRQVI